MNETIKASSTRKSNGWAPTLEYQNGGRTLFRHYRKAITEEAGKRYFR